MIWFSFVFATPGSVNGAYLGEPDQVDANSGSDIKVC